MLTDDNKLHLLEINTNPALSLGKSREKESYDRSDGTSTNDCDYVR